jgi:hypothetical protein
MYNQHDLSLVVYACYFFVLTCFHYSPPCVCCVSVDVYPVCFVVAASVWVLALFIVCIAAAFALAGFVSCNYLSKISSAVSTSISSSMFSGGGVTVGYVTFTTCAVGVGCCPGTFA